jgi:hypothetical protein
MRRIALIALLLSAVVGVVACGPSKAEIADQQKQQCFANENQIKLATNLVHADTGVYPDIKNVVAQLHVACPAGGVYSFDPNTDTVSCSIHGVAPPSTDQ